MFFKIKNLENEITEVCGVQEFSAPPGVVHIPYHIMEGMGIKEGSNVEISLYNPPNGSYVKLQPHKTEFIELSDPKAVLEKILSRDYPVVSQGQTIALYYKEVDKVYHIDIVKAEPAEVIKIINVNLNVDFDPPKDYMRSSPNDKRSSPNDKRSSPNDKQSSPNDKRSSPNDKRSSPRNKFPPSPPLAPPGTPDNLPNLLSSPISSPIHVPKYNITRFPGKGRRLGSE
jgi:ubiquitin fusion degradation protein 1